MKKFTFITTGLMLVLCVQSGYGNTRKKVENKISSYTQLIIQQRNNTLQAAGTLQKQKGINEVSNPDLNNLFVDKNGVTYLKSFIRLTDNDYMAELQDAGVIIETRIANLATCLIPVNQIDQIAESEIVKGIEVAQLAHLTLDSVRRCSNVIAAHSGLAPLSKPYKGNGVIIGVVDTGFDFTHPNYYDQTGTTFRIQKVWNQVAKAGTPPAGYMSGAEYTSMTSIIAAQTDNKNATHGTHTSGIAAGSGYSTEYSGIAPASDIILVATDMTTTNIVNGVQYIIEKAKGASKPCVVNLSLGSDIGPHDGTSIADQMLDNMAGPGVILVGAAGNSGSDSIHIQKQFTGTSNESVSTFLVPASPAKNAMIADIWGRNNTVFSVQVMIYNTVTNTIIKQTGSYPVNGSNEQIILNTPNNNYTIQFINQLYNGNNNYNTLLYIEAGKTFKSPELIAVRVTGNNAGTMNMWATNGIFRNYNKTGFTAGATDYTVGEIGGVGNEIISVGAYTTKKFWYNLNNQKYVYNPTPALYKIASFSSVGPTADGRIKPDISAPGLGVVSGFNSFNSNYGSQNNSSVATRNFKNRTYYWGMDQGTSMACPVVAGTIALWLEANPLLTPTQIKTIISQSSFNPATTRALTQDNYYGWGKLNAYDGIMESIALSSGSVQSDQDISISIVPNPNNGRFRINTVAFFNRLQLVDLSGREVLSRKFEKAVQQSDIHLDHVMPGIYLLKIHTDNGSLGSKIIIR